eukprot:15435274-Alexandrium_andersonii.AAC.1
MAHFEQTTGLFSARSQLSVPDPIPGQDPDDSDVSSVHYTPIGSAFTSDTEAGARLGSEATSLADDESSDEPVEPASTDPYEEQAEVA